MCAGLALAGLTLACVMSVDLFAGTVYEGGAILTMRAPTILVFDSGLGGLTVFTENLNENVPIEVVVSSCLAVVMYERLGWQNMFGD